MKRTSMKAPLDLSFDKLFEFTKYVSFTDNGGYEKLDGIFISFGINVDDRPFFQTANSPKIFSSWDYMVWVKEETQFAIDLSEFAHQMLQNVTFQRFLRIELAKRYPETSVEFSFEYFPMKYANEIEPGWFQFIRVPYRTIKRDTLFMHTPGVLEEDMDLGFVKIRKPKFRYFMLDFKLGDVALEYYYENEPMMKLKGKIGKKERDRFKALCKTFYESLYSGLTEEGFEGIVVDFRGIPIKLQHKDCKKYSLNPLIFGDKK